MRGVSLTRYWQIATTPFISPSGVIRTISSMYYPIEVWNIPLSVASTSIGVCVTAAAARHAKRVFWFRKSVFNCNFILRIKLFAVLTVEEKVQKPDQLESDCFSCIRLLCICYNQ